MRTTPYKVERRSMADKVVCTVDLHGVEEELIALGPRIARRLFRRALMAVGEAFKQAIKAAAPVDKGGLKDSIDYKIKLSPKSDFGSVTIGPTYDAKAIKNSATPSESPGIYGMFVEFGLKVKKYTFHPFMRPVFDALAEKMIQLFADGLKEDLEEAVKGK